MRSSNEWHLCEALTVATVEDEMRLLTEAGCLTEEELRREGYYALLRERRDLRISLAVEHYKREDMALNRAAEIAGVTAEEMKRVLTDRGVAIRRGSVPPAERDATARRLGSGA